MKFYNVTTKITLVLLLASITSFIPRDSFACWPRRRNKYKVASSGVLTEQQAQKKQKRLMTAIKGLLGKEKIQTALKVLETNIVKEGQRVFTSLKRKPVTELAQQLYKEKALPQVCTLNSVQAKKTQETWGNKVKVVIRSILQKNRKNINEENALGVNSLDIVCITGCYPIAALLLTWNACSSNFNLIQKLILSKIGSILIKLKKNNENFKRLKEQNDNDFLLLKFLHILCLFSYDLVSGDLVSGFLEGNGFQVNISVWMARINLRKYVDKIVEIRNEAHYSPGPDTEQWSMLPLLKKVFCNVVKYFGQLPSTERNEEHIRSVGVWLGFVAGLSYKEAQEALQLPRQAESGQAKFKPASKMVGPKDRSRSSSGRSSQHSSCKSTPNFTI